jgi:hypothetical protein
VTLSPRIGAAVSAGCTPRDKKPCEGPLPETSEAEPSRSCSSPISESTSAVTTRSGRIVIEPTRLVEHDDYVEQLGRLRDQRDQPWKQQNHVTKDAQIEALTAEVSELHKCYMALLAARLPIPGEHARRMLAASLWDLYPGCPRVPLLLATSMYF